MALRSALRVTWVVCFAASLGACAAPPAVVASVSEAPRPMTAQNLVGATPASLSAQFGPPALLRMDGAAQVWLYHSPVCGLNLILYPDHAGVPHVAAAVPDNGDAAGCVASMARGLTDAALEHPASS
jgi:hypothetical protein